MPPPGASPPPMPPEIAPGSSAASRYANDPQVSAPAAETLFLTGRGDPHELSLRYGELTSIAGPSGSGKTLLGLHAITTHLLTHPRSYAAWVDTVGGFSARWLKGVVEERIADARTKAASQGEGEGGRVVVGDEEVVKMVEEVLDRVWVMRVFDWWGVEEAVGEVRGYVEGHAVGGESVEADLGGGEADVGGEGNGEGGIPGPGNGKEEDGNGTGNGNAGGSPVVETSPLSPVPSSPSSLPSSPLSLPPPSSQIIPPPTLAPQLAPPTRRATEIPDSDAESDEEDILLSPPSLKPSPPPLSASAHHSQYSQLPDEIPGSSDDEGDGSPPGSPELPLLPTYAYARGNTEIHLDGDGEREDIPPQVASSPPTIPSPSLATPSKNEVSTVHRQSQSPAIGILVVDTITHPVEALVTKAASSSGFIAVGGAGGIGTEVAPGQAVGGAYALLERYFRELGVWAGEWGVGVLLLNDTSQPQSHNGQPSPPPALGPMFQHMIDMSVLLKADKIKRPRGWHGHGDQGGLDKIGFEILHDRNGEWGGRVGVLGGVGR